MLKYYFHQTGLKIETTTGSKWNLYGDFSGGGSSGEF
jgi:hypothetical protein